MLKSATFTRVLAIVAVLAVVIALGVALWPGAEMKHVTAEFPRTVSLYKGSDIKILGVTVGEVDSVTPSGTKVIVKASYDAKYKVPADAKAAVVSPSIVGDRFIQLTPVYTKGAVLADNTRLGLDRTATPLELDEIFGSLNDLDKALGPEGANKPGEKGVGALTRLLDSTSRNFGGQGVQFNKTIKNLSRLTSTLSNNKDELFGTVQQVEQFVAALAKSDTTVRSFNQSLASAADLLAGERDDLAAALTNLGTAMTQVRGFVKENKDLLSSNIKGLNRISKTLVKQRKPLDEILRVAPGALNNLMLAYNPTTGTLDTRDALGEVANQISGTPANLLCSFLLQTGAVGKAACNVLKTIPVGRAGALKGTAGAADADGVTHREHVDPTLAGLVEVAR